MQCGGVVAARKKTQVVRSCTAIRKCNPRHSCGKSACGHAPQYVIIEGVHAYILSCGNTACGHAPQYTCMHVCTHASSCGKPTCGRAPQYHACIDAVIPHAVIHCMSLVQIALQHPIRHVAANQSKENYQKTAKPHTQHT